MPMPLDSPTSSRDFAFEPSPSQSRVSLDEGISNGNRDRPIRTRSGKSIPRRHTPTIASIEELSNEDESASSPDFTSRKSSRTQRFRGHLRTCWTKPTSWIRSSGQKIKFHIGSWTARLRKQHSIARKGETSFENGREAGLLSAGHRDFLVEQERRRDHSPPASIRSHFSADRQSHQSLRRSSCTCQVMPQPPPGHSIQWVPRQSGYYEPGYLHGSVYSPYRWVPQTVWEPVFVPIAPIGSPTASVIGLGKNHSRQWYSEP